VLCSVCGAVKDTKNERLPKTWKRSNDGIYCGKCWRERMLLRAVALPVVEIIDGTWDEFRKVLHVAWAETTQATNWMMTELYSGDVRRQKDQSKLPAMERRYLYPQARTRFPELPPVTVAALEQAVQAKYRAARYEIIWTCGRSLPTARYPQPLPLPNQAWSVAMDGERPVVSVRVGNRRWSLRLRGGPRYRRQLAAIRLLAADMVEQGQMDLYEQTIDGKKAVMCKMVAWLPRLERRPDAEGTLMVRTAEHSLLVAVNAKDEKLWTYHGDHLLRWSAEHRDRLQRWADDSKFEQRPVPSFAERREAAVHKYRDRMSSAVREIAASLASYAHRRKFAAVHYDDSDTSYCAGFPWYALRTRIETKLNELGITFEHARDPVEAKTPEPLAKGDV